MEDMDVIQTTVTVRTFFLKESNHIPCRTMKTEYFGQDKLLRNGCELLVFPNGYEKENEGYVSIEFHKFNGTCIASLIDASGNQRFSQSFTMSYRESRIEKLRIEKYISHKTLLSDPTELLANGIMTLMFYVQITPRNQNKINPNISLNFQGHLNDQCLLLDSPLAKRLSDESNYFRALLNSRMMENKTKIMPLPGNEMSTFYDIGRLLMGYNPSAFRSIKEIFDMYILADKYDIPFVSETCTCFMKLYAYVHGVEELSAYVQEYEKIEHLTKLLQTQIDFISQADFDKEITVTDKIILTDSVKTDRVFFKRPVHGCLWVYMNPNVKQKPLFLNQSHVSTIQNFIRDENEDYEFYK